MELLKNIMRRSRSLSFKKEQEQKFKSMLNTDDQHEQRADRVDRVDRVDRDSRKEKDERVERVVKDTSKSRIFSDSDSENESDDDIAISKISSASSQRGVQSYKDKERIDTSKSSKRELIVEDSESEYEEDKRDNRKDKRDEHREDKEDKPSRGRPKKVEKVDKIEKQRDEHSDSEYEEVKIKQKRNNKKDDYNEDKEDHRRTKDTRENKDKRRDDNYHNDEDVEDEREAKKKNSRMIVSKATFSKFVSSSNIDSTSSDIYPHLQQEMIEYIAEVIKIISNNDKDDEVVVKESHLKFCGDKSLAQGILDMKTFEKLYNETKTNNVTFTSESFKTLCKLTEVHVLEFLKKARGIMTHCGRKRLNLSDIELLKYILE